jgi:hypothetical protein
MIWAKETVMTSFQVVMGTYTANKNRVQDVSKTVLELQV